MLIFLSSEMWMCAGILRGLPVSPSVTESLCRSARSRNRSVVPALGRGTLSLVQVCGQLRQPCSDTAPLPASIGHLLFARYCSKDPTTSPPFYR